MLYMRITRYTQKQESRPLSTDYYSHSMGMSLANSERRWWSAVPASEISTIITNPRWYIKIVLKMSKINRPMPHTYCLLYNWDAWHQPGYFLHFVTSSMGCSILSSGSTLSNTSEPYKYKNTASNDITRSYGTIWYFRCSRTLFDCFHTLFVLRVNNPIVLCKVDWLYLYLLVTYLELQLINWTSIIAAAWYSAFK